MIVVLFVIVLVIARGGQSDSNSSGSDSAPGESIPPDRDEADTPAGPGPELIGKEIVVGPQGDFQTINAALQYVKEYFPIGRAEPQVVKVMGGRTYTEAIEIDNRTFEFHAKIRLVSGGAKPARLDPQGEGPVIRLISTDDVEIDGFELDGQDRQVVIELGNYMTGTKLRNLTMDAVSGIGIQGRSIAGTAGEGRLLIENIVVRGTKGTGIAVSLIAGDSTSTTSYVSLRGLRIVGPLSEGVLIDDAVVDLEIRKLIFANLNRGIHFVDGHRLRDVEICNNTFYENDIGIIFDTLPDATSDGLALRRNLFVNSTQSDAIVADGFDQEKLEQMLTSQGQPLARNMTTRSKSDANGIDLFSNSGVRGADFAFASVTASDPAFLAPSGTGPAGGLPGGTGDETYAGAVPPR